MLPVKSLDAPLARTGREILVHKVSDSQSSGEESLIAASTVVWIVEQRCTNELYQNYTGLYGIGGLR